MNAKTTAATCLIAGALLLSAGCAHKDAQDEPDLVPEPRSGSIGAEGFCERDASGLIVKVRNQTNTDVLVPTVTRVTFFPSGTSVDRPTAPMPGGSFALAQPFPIPAGCFNPDCSFTITVDAGNDVDESHGAGPDDHETNNTAQGVCIG